MPLPKGFKIDFSKRGSKPTKTVALTNKKTGKTITLTPKNKVEVRPKFKRTRPPYA